MKARVYFAVLPIALYRAAFRTFVRMSSCPPFAARDDAIPVVQS